MPNRMTKKLHKCIVCEKEFKERYYLRRHAQVHTGEKPFQCIICHKRFITSSNLTRHSQLHSKEKPYKCDLCHVAYKVMPHLTLHRLRVHNIGNRSKCCVFCNKGFNDYSNLNAHVLRHIREKPSICNFCGKEFVSNYERTLHVAKHHDKKQSARTGEGSQSFKLGSTQTIKSQEEVTISVQPSLAILAAVMGFMRNDSNILVISTSHVSITCQRLKKTILGIIIFDEPEDFFNSSDPVKALVCNENYDSVIIASNIMKLKALLVINATEECITEKMRSFLCIGFESRNIIKFVSDALKWIDLVPALQFQVIQNWKKRFGFNLSSDQIEHIEGQFLINLVNDKGTMQDTMPWELRRYVH